jgi:hypothetical protein
MKTAKLQSYINNIAMVIDSSGSMSHLSDTVIKVFDSQVKYLAARSKELQQEMRISVYTFASTTTCLCTDMDVLRMPSLKDMYSPGGGTALLDATLLAINDLKEFPQKYVDRAFMIYVISDGENNEGNVSPAQLRTAIQTLPDNFTVAYLAPTQNAVFEAKKCGFSTDNILLWDATSKVGLEKAAEAINNATNSFMQARATGVRGTKNLFNLNTNNLKSDIVTKKLDALDPKDYEILNVRKDGQAIKEFVESWKLPYVVGSSYYQLSKVEKVQANKNVIVQNKLSGKLYHGDKARELLGLPDHEVKVVPSSFNNYNIYCQSTSVNRKLVANTQLVYIK